MNIKRAGLFQRFLDRIRGLPEREDLGHFTLEHPARDLAPVSECDSVGVPSAKERHHIFHNRCRKEGHDWSIRGYANGAGPFSWLHWEIGSYEACSHCWARKFEQLETREHLDEVLRMEREHWEHRWSAQNDAAA